MAINVQTAPTHKVYYPWSRKLMWVFIGIELCITISSLANDRLVISAIGVLLTIYIMWLGLTIRLVISPGGVAYETLGLYSVVTLWSNVEQIAEIPFRSGGTIRALLLREPTATGWYALDAALLPEHRGRVIPLSGPRWASRVLWGKTEQLEQEIQRYAPHVQLES